MWIARIESSCDAKFCDSAILKNRRIAQLCDSAIPKNRIIAFFAILRFWIAKNVILRFLRIAESWFFSTLRFLLWNASHYVNYKLLEYSPFPPLLALKLTSPLPLSMRNECDKRVFWCNFWKSPLLTLFKVGTMTEIWLSPGGYSVKRARFPI